MSIEQSLDDLWFKYLLDIRIKYDKLLSPHSTTFLVPDKSSDANDLFFSDYLLEREDLSLVLQKIKRLTDIVESDNLNQRAVTRLWLSKLSQLNDQVFLLMEMQRLFTGTASFDEVNRVQVLMNETIGGVNREIFNLCLAELCERLSSKQSIGLLESLKIEVSQNLINTYSEEIKKYDIVDFEVVGDIDTEKSIDMLELRDLFTYELAKLNLENSWEVKFDVNNRYKRVMVFYKNKVVMIPSPVHNPDLTISHKKYLKLVEHEIKTHVLRSENGYRSKLKLLSVGLDHYQEAEEGLATFREQRLTGTGKYLPGFETYFTIGLALGYDRGCNARSPLELFNILVELNQVLFGQDVIKAKDSALKRIRRVYVTTRSGNIVNTRDLCYRSGNIKIHHYMSMVDNAEDIINVGLYDPTNKTHVDSLKELEII